MSVDVEYPVVYLLIAEPLSGRNVHDKLCTTGAAGSDARVVPVETGDDVPLLLPPPFPLQLLPEDKTPQPWSPDSPLFHVMAGS